MHVAQAADAVGFAQAGADGPVDGQRFFVALPGLRVLGQAHMHVAQAADAVGFAQAVTDGLVMGNASS